jgi:hypothetical protein
MASRDHLSDYQFSYRNDGPQYSFSGYFNDSEDDEANGYDLYTHAVTAKHKPTNRVVGEMLYQSGGPLFQIDVDEDHQRRGVAEGMVRHGIKVHEAAKNIGADIPRPQRASHETDEGAEFGESMVKKGLFK